MKFLICVLATVLTACGGGGTGTRQVLSQGVISYVDLESQVNGVIGGHSVAVQSGSS